MKTKLFFLPILVLLLLNSEKLAAQNFNNDPFLIEKGGLFKNQDVLKKSGFTLTQPQILQFMANDPNMASRTKSLTGLFITQSVFTVTGSLLSSWPLVQLSLDKDPNIDLTYYGLGSVVVSLILKKIFMKKAVKAAQYYNNGYKDPVSFKVNSIINENGTGLAISF